jgi:hypothetical protein
VIVSLAWSPHQTEAKCGQSAGNQKLFDLKYVGLESKGNNLDIIGSYHALL